MHMINRRKFLKLFKKAQRKAGVATSKIAKNAGFSQSYTYKLVSPKNHSSKIPGITARKLCHGLNLSARQTDGLLAECENRSAGQAQTKPMNTHGKFSIPQLVRNIMKTQKMSYNQLAKQSGLNDHRLKDFTSGKGRFSKISLIKLARGLNISPRKLLSANATQVLPTAKPVQSKPSPQYTAPKANPAPQSVDAEPAAYTGPKVNTLENQSSTLRPEVLELAKHINEKLSDSEIAVLQLIIEKMK